MAYDGSIRIDTSLDTKGIADDLGKLGNIATTGALAAGAALGALSVAVVKVGSEFGYQMSRVQAISGATGEELEKLKALAVQLGADTAFSAKEAAEGMENLASAGFDTNEIMSAMPGLLDLAAVSGGDVSLASESAATALRAFGLEASQAGHVADVFARAAADTNAEVADMGEALKYVAPSAKMAGISLEETAAAIGLMSDAGVKGSQAGTTLRTALVNLAKPTSKMQALMDELNLRFFDSEGKMVSLEDQILMLESAFDGYGHGLGKLTDEQRQNALATLYGKEALAGMSILVEQGSAKLATLTTSLENSSGAAAEMAGIMQDNLKSDIEQVGGALESLAIQLFTHFESPLRDAAQAGIKAIDQLARELSKPDMKKALDSLASAFSGLVEVIATVVTGGIQFLVAAFGVLAERSDDLIGALAMLLAAFIAYNAVLLVTQYMSALAAGFSVLEAAMLVVPAIMNAVTAAQWLLNAAMLANPIGLVVAGAAALAVGLAALIMWIDQDTEAEKKLKEEKEELIAANDELIDSIGQSSKNYADAIKGMDTQASAAQSLTKRLFDLEKAEGHTAEGQAKMRVLVGQLNQALPELNLSISKETGLLDMNEEAVQNVIKAKQEQLKMQAADERAVELAKELVDIETQRLLIEEKIASASFQLEDGTIQQAAYNETVAALNTELETLSVTYSDTAASLDILTESQVASNQALAEMGLDEASQALAEYEAGVNSLAEIWGVSSESIRQALEQTGLSFEEFDQVALETMDQITNSFKEIPAQFELSLDELMEIQRTNIERYAEFQRNIVELSGKLSEGALSELALLGPGANSVLQELIDGGEAKWDEYNALYAEKSQLAVSSAAGIVSDGTLATASDKSISDAATAAEQNGTLAAAYGKQATTAGETFTEDLEKANLPDVADKTIEDTGKAVDNNSAIKDAATKQVQDTHTAAAAEVQSQDFSLIGEAMMAGIVLGIDNGSASVIAAARDAARSAYESAKSELDINSPSGRFRYLGDMSIEGYADALRDGEATWQNAVSHSIRNTLATADAQRFNIAQGYSSVITNTSQNTQDGDIIFEKGSIVIEGTPINSDLDIERVGRKLGEDAAKQIRRKGGLIRT